VTNDAPTPPRPDAATVRDRVLRGLAGNRVPGLHFVGHFLGVATGKVGPDGVELFMPGNAHCLGPDGQVDISALAIFADMALATAVRRSIEPVSRMGTVRLELHYTGGPVGGDLSATATRVATKPGSSLRHFIADSVVRAGGAEVCRASGEFVQLDLPAGVERAAFSLPSRSDPPVEALDPALLTAEEQAILDAAGNALGKADAATPFIRRFLGGGHAERTAHGSEHRVALAPHLGNRVGHAQGGILFALAASAARHAAPAGMKLSGITAWYLRPGKGDALVVRSTVAHAGRATALVNTEITGTDGALVLYAVTQHVAGSSA